MEQKTIDRFRGCLYGQAIGDALGLGTELMRILLGNILMDYNTMSRYTRTDIGSDGKLAIGLMIQT